MPGIGDAIASLRGHHQLSQQDLADRLKTSRPVIAQIESGHRGISHAKAKKIADVFGIPVAVLHLLAEEEPDELVVKLQQMARESLGMETVGPRRHRKAASAN